MRWSVVVSVTLLIPFYATDVFATSNACEGDRTDAFSTTLDDITSRMAVGQPPVPLESLPPFGPWLEAPWEPLRYQYTHAGLTIDEPASLGQRTFVAHGNEPGVLGVAMVYQGLFFAEYYGLGAGWASSSSREGDMLCVFTGPAEILPSHHPEDGAKATTSPAPGASVAAANDYDGRIPCGPGAGTITLCLIGDELFCEEGAWYVRMAISTVAGREAFAQAGVALADKYVVVCYAAGLSPYDETITSFSDALNDFVHNSQFGRATQDSTASMLFMFSGRWGGGGSALGCWLSNDFGSGMWALGGFKAGPPFVPLTNIPTNVGLGANIFTHEMGHLFGGTHETSLGQFDGCGRPEGQADIMIRGAEVEAAEASGATGDASGHFYSILTGRPDDQKVLAFTDGFKNVQADRKNNACVMQQAEITKRTMRDTHDEDYSLCFGDDPAFELARESYDVGDACGNDTSGCIEAVDEFADNQGCEASPENCDIADECMAGEPPCDDAQACIEGESGSPCETVHDCTELEGPCAEGEDCVEEESGSACAPVYDCRDNAPGNECEAAHDCVDRTNPTCDTAFTAVEECAGGEDPCNGDPVQECIDGEISACETVIDAVSDCTSMQPGSACEAVVRTVTDCAAGDPPCDPFFDCLAGQPPCDEVFTCLGLEGPCDPDPWLQIVTDCLSGASGSPCRPVHDCGDGEKPCDVIFECLNGEPPCEPPCENPDLQDLCEPVAAPSPGQGTEESPFVVGPFYVILDPSPQVWRESNDDAGLQRHGEDADQRWA